jgi:hypothetical protein
MTLPSSYNLFNKAASVPSANPVLTVAASYVTGDYVGTSGVAMVFSGCANTPGGGGWVIGAKLLDKASQSVQTELWLFTTAVTPPADSAAWTISDADLQFLVAVIPFNASDYFASAVNSTCDGMPLNGLYGCLVTRGSPTYASLDLTVIPSLMMD